MQVHHQRHHQTYITNYNKALEQLHDAITKGDSATVVKLQGAIKFNGGGHINHSVFWKNLAPISEGGGEPPKGSLGSAINAHFGFLESLVPKMNAEGAALQGSGWVWLGVDKELKKLVVETTANEVQVTSTPLRRIELLLSLQTYELWLHLFESLYALITTNSLLWDPLVTKGSNLVPLVGIDVWEHACYLQYKNVRPNYLKYIWKVINWKYASEVFEKECL